jgi:hypothetical protein
MTMLNPPPRETPEVVCATPVTCAWYGAAIIDELTEIVRGNDMGAEGVIETFVELRLAEGSWVTPGKYDPTKIVRFTSPVKPPRLETMILAVCVVFCLTGKVNRVGLEVMAKSCPVTWR